jgi:hypothetical protein
MVEKAGFAKYRQSPIVLGINERADLNVSLSVSASTEIVDVTADAPLVNTRIGLLLVLPRKISDLTICPNSQPARSAAS